MKPTKSEGVETRYQSNSPGKYWIKVSDANKLRDKALKAEREETDKKVELLKKPILDEIKDARRHKMNNNRMVVVLLLTVILERIDKAFKGEKK